MATTPAMNRVGKRNGKTKKRIGRAPTNRDDDDPDPGSGCLDRRGIILDLGTPGLSELHHACLHGQLATVKQLVESMVGRINSSGPQGLRPIHLVLSSQSSPNTRACLTYLVEQGADVNATTDSGQTPLHLAASEGFLDCAEILVQAGANVLAKDHMELTPLDLSRVWCQRNVARYLKSCMWQADKKKEMEERKRLQALYKNLIDMAKEGKAKKKVTVSQYHTGCLPPNQATSRPNHEKGTRHQQPAVPHKVKDTITKSPVASKSRPWTIYMGNQPKELSTEPDLQDIVIIMCQNRNRAPQYSTKWDSTPRNAPDLPLGVLERVLFPRNFPSRINYPEHFQAQTIMDVQHKRRPQGQRSSPMDGGRHAPC